MNEYLHEYRGREKVVYLNEYGRNYIASEKEVKKSSLFDHMLLANDAYIYFDCPQTWIKEYAFEREVKPKYDFAIQLNGKTPTAKEKIVSDAVFTRNGYVYLIEIDNIRDMRDNMKKIKKYKEMWKDIAEKFQMKPVLYFFTTTETRKRKLIDAAKGKGMNAEVMTFNEIK